VALEINNSLPLMLFWLGELTLSSYFLSYGGERLSNRYGAKFVGRTLLSVATTLPEMAVVIYASSVGFYGIAVGSGLGSNLLMMTLGFAIMLLISTTRLSKAPTKGINVEMFKLDKIFLLVTAIASALLFFDGYTFFDGIIFAGLFVAYVIMAFMEMKSEAKKTMQVRSETKIIKSKEEQQLSSSSRLEKENTVIDEIGGEDHFNDNLTRGRSLDKTMLKAILVFAAGTIGIFFGAEPFIRSLEQFSIDTGVSVVVLAVIISPIAAEMPEKISMMFLSRRGGIGASIAIANVLGSKILNNTLLLALAVFAAMYHGGFYVHIDRNPILTYQMILVTLFTVIALVPMFLKKEIGLKVGVMLAAMYILGISIQFLLPQDIQIH